MAYFGTKQFVSFTLNCTSTWTKHNKHCNIFKTGSEATYGHEKPQLKMPDKEEAGKFTFKLVE